MTMARATKDFKQNMVSQFMDINTPRKGVARWHLCFFLGKVEWQDTYVLTDGVQVVLSKRVRRTDQDWSKYNTHIQKLQCIFMGVSNQFRRQNHCRQEKSASITSSADRYSSSEEGKRRQVFQTSCKRTCFR